MNKKKQLDYIGRKSYIDWCGKGRPCNQQNRVKERHQIWRNWTALLRKFSCDFWEISIMVYFSEITVHKHIMENKQKERVLCAVAGLKSHWNQKISWETFFYLLGAVNEGCGLLEKGWFACWGRIITFI